MGSFLFLFLLNFSYLPFLSFVFGTAGEMSLWFKPHIYGYSPGYLRTTHKNCFCQPSRYKKHHLQDVASVNKVYYSQILYIIKIVIQRERLKIYQTIYIYPTHYNTSAGTFVFFFTRKGNCWNSIYVYPTRMNYLMNKHTR